MNNEQFRKEIAKQCGFEYTAIQASSAGDWPSVESQEEYNERMDAREDERSCQDE